MGLGQTPVIRGIVDQRTAFRTLAEGMYGDPRNRLVGNIVVDLSGKRINQLRCKGIGRKGIGFERVEFGLWRGKRRRRNIFWLVPLLARRVYRRFGRSGRGT